MPQRGDEEGVLLEAVAAAPAPDELVVQRGEVETRHASAQHVGVLERNRCGVPLDEASQRRQRRRGAAVEFDAAEISVEVGGGIDHGGSCGTSIAVALARAGLEIELGCRTAEQAQAIAAERENARYLPGVQIPDSVRVSRAADLELERHDLVVFAVPSRALPVTVAQFGARVPSRAGVLVLAKGLVAPHGSLPAAYVAERTLGRAVACLGGPAHAADALTNGASFVAACANEAFGRQLADVFTAAGFEVQLTSDVTGVEPMTSVTPMEMKKRQDVVTDGGIPDDIVRNAPAAEDHFFVVPKVVE